MTSLENDINTLLDKYDDAIIEEIIRPLKAMMQGKEKEIETLSAERGVLLEACKEAKEALEIANPNRREWERVKAWYTCREAIALVEGREE